MDGFDDDWVELTILIGSKKELRIRDHSTSLESTSNDYANTSDMINTIDQEFNWVGCWFEVATDPDS